MCDYDIKPGFDIKGLSLIDVSSEDDCLLINSPICDQTNPQFSGSFDEHGKLEEDGPRGRRRRDFRKWSTWDSSFFSSIDFLEPGDVNESYDASTMVDSKATRRKSLEDDSFGPASYNVKKELETTDPRTVSSSKKLGSANKDKVMQKGAPKKPNIVVKDPGKTMTQSVSRSGVSASSLYKPPKGVIRVGPISTTQTERASLGCKDVKMEKDAKSVAGRGTTISKSRALVDSRKTVPRPISSRPSLNMISNDSKIAAEGKSRAGRSQISTLAKLSSSMFAASSYSEWSSESSSTSTTNRRPNTGRASLGSGSGSGSGSGKGLVTNYGAQQVLDSETHHTHQSDDAEVTGSLAESENEVSNASTGLLNQVSIKPSGLRPPSPKLAYSNGVKVGGHTRNRSMPSLPSVFIDLPQSGSKSTNPSGRLNKAHLGNGSRNPKISTGITPKLQNKPSPRIGRESYSKAQGIGSAEKKLGPDLPKLVVKLVGKEGARIKDTKIVPLAVPDY